MTNKIDGRYLATRIGNPPKINYDQSETSLSSFL